MTPPANTPTVEPQAEPIVIHVPPYDEPPRSPLVPAITTTSGGVARLIAEPSPVPASVPQPAVVTEPKRASALDALRGLFLASMTFGFTISNNHLPLWMYHRQFPPPGDTPVNVAGISWRDLTYVAFLFTMSAALPITLSRRIDKGEPELGIIF